MSAPWTPQQREWLQALGHDVLMLAGTAMALEAGEAAPLDAPATVATKAPARAVHDQGDGPLLRALLRAAGGRELGEIAAWLPDPATLRGNAAAKRALWPRLRTLRGTPSRA